uniref:DNA polymerase alpha subunit B n=1 Tax=Stomoxys calcitrans TaxID=35570 RepID=A0A1I8PTT3_STOCA
MNHLLRIYEGLPPEYRHYIRRHNFRTLDELIGLTDDFELLKRDESRQKKSLTSHMIIESEQNTPDPLFVGNARGTATIAGNVEKHHKCLALTAAGSENVSVVVNGVRINTLIDTGASLSYMDEATRQTVQTNGLEAKPMQRLIQMADKRVTTCNYLLNIHVIGNNILTDQLLTDQLLADQLLTNRLLTNRLLTNRLLTNRLLTNRLLTNRLLTNHLLNNRLLNNCLLTNRLLTNRLLTNHLLNNLQDLIKTIGIIHSDYDGPLDPSSTILVGSDESMCHTVRLNFSKTKSVGVFPGQVVMVTGMNPKGDVLMVEEVITEQNLQPPKPPQIADRLSFVIAAGPYTHDDDLVYDPLQDLVMYLKENRPNVLILCGPFMEADHKIINDNVTLAETFEAFFEKMITGIVEAIGQETTILVVASHRDAHTDCVYPTMSIQMKKSFANVHMLPDPSMIDLNGLIIGMTSTDIVDHILAEELAVNAGDKVKRVVNYLLHQKSFYPLNHPKEDQMCLDSDLASKYANIDRIPNILILPSTQKCFLRVVNGCLAINPGRLADNIGGTFARFIINPPAPKDEANLFNYVGCQVRKV